MIFCTTEERSDGFGAQFQTRIYCILIAENSGKKYIHTTVKNIEHNYDNDPEFINNVEKLMNLKNGYDFIKDDTSLKNCEILKIWDLINKFESDINLYLNSDSLKNIKNVFWKNKNRNFFNNDKINVAVHIRRPNNHDTRIDGVDTSIEYYFNIINIIKEKYKHKEKPLLFHIYSQNDITAYHEFDKTDIQFHLNENLFDSFIGMVAADILVTSRSSLSYVAAILSDGEIYYNPFWHPPGENWIVC
jgi:hypothetical protein